MATLDTILGDEKSTKLAQQDAPAARPAASTPASPETETPAASTPASPVTETPAASTPASPATERGHMSYAEMTRQTSPYKPPTEEELARERKRQKREAVFAAIGDGLSAFHHAYSTTRGTKSMVDPRVSLSGKVRDRYDRLKKERDANTGAYMSAYMKSMQMDDEAARDDRNWRHALEREKVADERYEIKAAQDKAMADLDEKLRKHQITAAEHKAEQERIAAQFAEENEKLKQENLRAGVQQKTAAAGASRASANASNARANYYRNGGGKKSGPTLQLEKDEPMRFEDGRDYDRAVMRLAPDYGVKTTVTETVSDDGFTKKQRTVQRPVKDIAADIEREAARRKEEKKKKKPNPMGGDNPQPTNGKKQNPMS